MQSSQVSVYVCSTPEDSKIERRLLRDTVAPQMKSFCKLNYGIDFQFLDPYQDDDTSWSYIDERREFAFDCIKDCRNHSLSTSFLTLLGEKYGNVTLPETILADEFDIITSMLRLKESRELRNWPLLAVWYKVDNYAMPEPLYILQKYEQVNPKPASRFQRLIYGEVESDFSWRRISEQLEVLLRRGVQIAFNSGALHSDAKCFGFFKSDFEKQIDHGLRSDSIVVERRISDIRNYLKEPCIHPFLDLCVDPTTGQTIIDSFSDVSIEKLKESIADVINIENRMTYKVLWKFDEGICLKGHAEYLNSFCDFVVDRLKNQIHFSMSSQLKLQHLKTTERQFHWKQAHCMAREFQGQEALMELLKSYTLSCDHLPLLLHGECGVGKSYIISKTACMTRQWTSGELLVCVRFSLTSPESASLIDVVRSLCSEISRSIMHEFDCENNTDKTQVIKYFKNLLIVIPSNLSLVLLISDIDLLCDDMSWLPSSLPENVKVILSSNAAPEVANNAFHRLTGEVDPLDNSIRVHCDPVVACKWFEMWLERLGRRLTDGQREALTASPPATLLVASILTAEAAEWNARDRPAACTLQSIVACVLRRARAVHGGGLVDGALSLIDASSAGLSDAEIVDVLTRDFGAGGVRFSAVTWLRVKRSLAPLLATTGGHLIRWRCSSVSRLARRERLATYAHCTLADYFAGSVSISRPPSTESAGGRTRRATPATTHAADLVYKPVQPVVVNALRHLYNGRKLCELPRHLISSGRFSQLERDVLFDYDWIKARIYSQPTVNKGIEAFLGDLQLCTKRTEMKCFSADTKIEAKLLRETLLAARKFLVQDVTSLAIELSGRLLTYYCQYANLARLIRQCDTRAVLECGAVPSMPFPLIPGGPWIHCLKCDHEPTSYALRPLHTVKGLPPTTSNFLYTKHKDSPLVNIIDPRTAKKVRPDVVTSLGNMYISPNGSRIVVVNSSGRPFSSHRNRDGQAVKIHDSIDGSFLGQIIPANHFQSTTPSKYQIKQVEVGDDYVCVLLHTETSCVLVIDISTCEVHHVFTFSSRVQHISTKQLLLLVSGRSRVASYDLHSALCTAELDVDLKIRAPFIFNCHGNQAFSFTDDSLVVAIVDSYGASDGKESCRGGGGLGNERAIGDGGSIIGNNGSVSVNNGVSSGKGTVVGNGVESVECSTGRRVVRVQSICLRERFLDDSVRGVCVSDDARLLAIMGGANILVYDARTELPLAHFGRPVELPSGISGATSAGVDGDASGDSMEGVSFSSVRLLLDNVVAIAGGNVYVWSLDGAQSRARVRARPGPIVNSDLDGKHLLTRTRHSSEFDVWSLAEHLSSSSRQHATPTAVRRLLALGGRDARLALSVGVASEAVAVRSTRSGALVDLLAHDDVVACVAGVAGGDHVFTCTLATSNRGPKNRLWNVNERRVTREWSDLGALDAVAAPGCGLDVVAVVERGVRSAHVARYSAGGGDTARSRSLAINELSTPAFVVGGSADCGNAGDLIAFGVRWDRSVGEDNRAFCVVCLSDLNSYCVTAGDLHEATGALRLLLVKPGGGSNILVLYTSEKSGRVNHYDHCYHLARYCVRQRCVLSITRDLVTPQSDFESLIFADTFIIDESSHVIDIESGVFLKRVIAPNGAKPVITVLQGTAIVYTQATVFYVVNIKDDRIISKVNVHSRITCLTLSDEHEEQRHLLIGCEDGTVSAVVIIDPMSEHEITQVLLRAIPARLESGKFRPQSTDKADVILNRCWSEVDSLNQFPVCRPSSTNSHNSTKSRKQLDAIPPLIRPQRLPSARSTRTP